MLVAGKRILAALVALILLAVLAPSAAQACSCVPRTEDSVRRWLAEGSTALIGTVVAAREINAPEPTEPDPDRPAPPVLDRTYAYTVQVERAFNAELGAETTIVTGSNGAMCGVGYRVGQRFGAFIGRDRDGAWGTSSCSQVAPDELIAASLPVTPPPPPPPPPPVPPVPPTPPVPPVDEGRPEPRTPAPALRARFDGRVALGGPRAGSDLQRLPAEASERVRLQLDAPARGVRFAFARADGRRVGRLSDASAVRRSGGKARSARLPRTLPRRADRLLVFVDHGRGRPRATFAVGLGQPATASVAVTAPGRSCRGALVAL